mgnify:CR=1 FL=1|jgi:hypothetical protein
MKRILRKAESSKFYKKCYYCDTEFEYERSDIKASWDSRFMTHLKVVTCPCCNRELIHNDGVRSNISTESL